MCACHEFTCSLIMNAHSMHLHRAHWKLIHVARCTQWLSGRLPPPSPDSLGSQTGGWAANKRMHYISPAPTRTVQKCKNAYKQTKLHRSACMHSDEQLSRVLWPDLLFRERCIRQEVHGDKTAQIWPCKYPVQLRVGVVGSTLYHSFLH